MRLHPAASLILLAVPVLLAASCGGKTDLGVDELGGAGSSGSGSGAHGSSASGSGGFGSSGGSGGSSSFGSSGGSGTSSGFGSSGGTSSGSGSSSGIVGSSSGPIDAGGPYDGTTGKACKSDVDCQPAGGPGVNRCTSDGFFGSGDSLYPTSVCMSVQPCDPGSDGLAHYCDGPDDPASPGVCVPTGGGGPAQGICLPQCTFRPDGTPAKGCVGKDACNVYSTALDAAGAAVGYCFAGCATDADCAAPGQHCQADQGTCVTTVAKDSPPGAGCDANASPYPCNCIANPGTGLGYCAPFCRVGGAPCGAGTTCDASLPTGSGWKAQNPGLGGYCAATCKGDGNACPANSTCQSIDLAGPDCLP